MQDKEEMVNSREQNRSTPAADRTGSGILSLTALLAVFGVILYTGMRCSTLPSGAATALNEEVIYIDSVEWVSTHPSFDHVIDVGVRDVCRLVTAQDTLTVRLFIEAGRGSGLEVLLDIQARARVLITIPVVIRYGIDISSGLPSHLMHDGFLRIELPEPRILGWHISHSTMPEIEADLRRSLLTTPYELYTQTLRGVSDSVEAVIDSHALELLSSCRERTEDLLETQFRELGVADNVEILWRVDR